jgi:hypothetical protein
MTSISRLLLALCAAAVLLGADPVQAGPPAPPPASTPKHPSELAGLDARESSRAALSLTIYNQDLALVRDVRNLTLPSGTSDLRFLDVASAIDPTSVHIRSVDGATAFSVIEQNYRYDLISPDKLLDRYVGREMEVFVSEGGDRPGRWEKATLLSNTGGPVYRIGDRIAVGEGTRVRLPDLPADLAARPTLVWKLDAGSGGPRRVEASYLTSQISWSADYIAMLADDGRHADLTGWVTIDNRSGAAYRNAGVQLVAGDIHRVMPEAIGMAMEAAAAPMAKRYEPQFREEGFFEYHLYTLNRRATILDRETKQIQLLAARDIPVAKEMLYFGAAESWRTQDGEVRSNQKVGVYLRIRNAKEKGLGMPLPKGRVRLYQRDKRGTEQFLGEDEIDHTPRNEELKLKVGDAFDVVGSRRQTEYKRTFSIKGLYAADVGFEVEIRNHKQEPVTVGILEPLFGDWRVVSSSHPWKKVDAGTLRFDVKVPADKSVKVTYKVHVED